MFYIDLFFIFFNRPNLSEFLVCEMSTTLSRRCTRLVKRYRKLRRSGVKPTTRVIERGIDFLDSRGTRYPDWIEWGELVLVFDTRNYLESGENGALEYIIRYLVSFKNEKECTIIEDQTFRNLCSITFHMKFMQTRRVLSLISIKSWLNELILRDFCLFFYIFRGNLESFTRNRPPFSPRVCLLIYHSFAFETRILRKKNQSPIGGPRSPISSSKRGERKANVVEK